MTRCESYPLCSGTIYFPTAPYKDYKITAHFYNDSPLSEQPSLLYIID